MTEKIIVVGGYGQVGQVICKELGELHPGKVFAAGRNFEKAEQFSLRTGRKVLPLTLDVHERPFPIDLLEGVSLVIMCLDQQDTEFIQQCVKQKVNYIDITASYTFLSEVQKIKPAESTIVLSVGLAPGLTNMLTKQGTQAMDQVNSADIYILLGLGEQHGRAAIEWTVDTLNAVYSVRHNGKKEQVESFTDGKYSEFPAGLGRRKAYRFNFSDQHVLPTTLGIPSVSTRLCFDSAMMTSLLAGLKKTGLYRLLQQPFIRSRVVNLFEKSHWGSEIYVIMVDAVGLIDGKSVNYRGSIYGQKEFDITGKVAAFVAKNMYAKEFQPGVFHMEALFQPTELFEDLGDLITIDERFETTI
ncbi:saccharopine dehydrogenase family protein [Ectobacillus panaciterrae]|uniref:saccharopine dehydrogenase family protein n=1 Tax=Ectobacillus panaciterrae TaxID=363872 RepID=UPI0003F7A06E|nr:saccharopine dehydrogenase NADP-binding domain-containing protein [Ectobacillus panaciterrae]